MMMVMMMVMMMMMLMMMIVDDVVNDLDQKIILIFTANMYNRAPSPNAKALGWSLLRTSFCVRIYVTTR